MIPIIEVTQLTIWLNRVIRVDEVFTNNLPNHGYRVFTNNLPSCKRIIAIGAMVHVVR